MIIVAKIIAAFVALFLLMMASAGKHHGQISNESFAESWNDGFSFMSHIIIGFYCLLIPALVIRFGWKKFKQRTVAVGNDTEH